MLGTTETQSQILSQTKNKTLADSREELADRLLTLAARIDALKQGNYCWFGEFYGAETGTHGFLETFKDIIPRTAHEKAIAAAKWNGLSLCQAIENYFKNPYKEIDTGIRLAREYFKVLITSGIIHDHE